MRTTIGELAAAGVLTFGDGYRTRRDQLREPGYRILRVADVADGVVNRTGPDFVSEELTAQIGSKLSEQGDILLTTKGTVGRVAEMPAGERVVYSPQLCYFRLNDEDRLSRRFLSLWFRSAEFVRQASHRANNTDMAPYINLADIRSLEIEVPPIATQRGIAEVLGAFDDKIAANRALGLAADAVAEATFMSLCATSIVPLGTVADVNRTRVQPQSGGYLKYIDIASVTDGAFEFPSRSEWTDAPGRARRGVAVGDTVWSTVRPNRRSHALVLDDDPELVASTGLAVLSPRTVGFSYLYQATKMLGFQNYLERVAEGSAYPAVRADRFLNAPIPWADERAAAMYEERIAPRRMLQHAATVESRSLARARDELLPLLMSGKLTVKDAEKRAEEVL